MWTRKELKERAKLVLKSAYWKCFLVSLIVIFVGGNNNGGSFPSFNSFIGSNEYMDPEIMRVIFIVFGIVFLGISLFRIFLGFTLEIGGRKFFIKASESDVSLNYLGFGFNGKYYVKIILTMIYKGIMIFLWSLLLFIPGIIKSYAYRMVPYILADNPEIGPKRALQLSNEMTKGEKWSMFVLDLSFIGWMLLGTLALFVGVFFVQPYIDTTYAELYKVLRENTLVRNLCTYEELNMEVANNDNEYSGYNYF